MADLPRRVLILGDGAMGSMFHGLLASVNDVIIWARDPRTGEESLPLESVATDREIVLFALPASPHEELAVQLAPCLPEGAVCLSIAKGLDASARTPAQIFEHVLGANHHWGLVCGPMIARELAAGKAGFGVLAAPTATARAAVDLFAGTQLGLVADDDVHGSAWAVVLKNVYVPLVGAADALRLGDNMRGFLFTEAVAELEQIVTAMGGRPASARGLAGLGDLVTSATSESSHHRTIGGEIVSGRSDSVADSGDYIRSEGVHTARALREHALIHPGHYPLFDLACGFLEGALSLNDALGDYIRCRFSVGHA